jgi:RNA polymerase sigma-70 factor (ECF subfamily)
VSPWKLGHIEGWSKTLEKLPTNARAARFQEVGTRRRASIDVPSFEHIPLTSAAPQALTILDVERLVERHQIGVWRYLRSLGCEPTLADDLTQETFLAVLERPFHDFNPQATAGYLRRVAHNHFITHLRRTRKVVPLEEIQGLAETWTRIAAQDDGEEWLEALRACFARLPPRSQLALIMRFRDQASREQIAQALGITQCGAKNLMQRAKLQLARWVREQVDGPAAGQPEASPREKGPALSRKVPTFAPQIRFT